MVTFDSMKAKIEGQEADTTSVKQVKIRTLPRHILDAFDNLVPDNAAGQAKASVIILKHVDKLIGCQSGFNLPEDVIYVVKRLISGLVSHRQRVREGFCSTLQALLQLQPTTVALAYNALKELCTDKKNLSKEEARNFMTGELLGYGAFIRSGHVKNNASMRKEIIKRLFWIREKKIYYDIIVAHFLVHMMEKFTKSVINEEILPQLKPDLNVPLEKVTPCQLWLQLLVLRKFPESAPDTLNDMLKPQNYFTISSIIVKTAINIPNVHPCLGEVVSSLAAQKKINGESPVIQFWVTGLAPFMKKPTTKCLQLLFNALQLILLNVKTADEVRTVCNEDVITHLLNVISLRDKNLSASARGVGSALLQLATTNYEQDNSVQLAVVRVLIKKPGNIRFDQLTGTKLLGQMRVHFTTATIISVSKLIRKLIQDTSEQYRTGDKIGGANFLGRLVSHPRMKEQEHDTWKKEQLRLLMEMALLKPDTKYTVEQYQNVFFKCLRTQMSRIKKYRITLEYLFGEAEKAVQASLKDSSENALLSGKALIAWEKCIAMLAEIPKEDKIPPVALDVFQVLYTQMALYLLVNTKAREIVDELDIYDELDNCYKEAKKKKKKAKVNSEGDELYEPSWVDMVVELLLTLLPHENNLFRSLVQGVFWLLCPLMTPVALTLIVDVLDPAKQDDIIKMNNEHNEYEEEDDDDDDDSEDEDEDLEEEEEDDNEEEDMEFDEVELEEDIDNELEGDDEFELKKQMLTAMGDIEVDVDMDSVPQEELDRIDKSLGALVGEYLSQKKNKKSFKRRGVERLQTDEKYLLHFRSRVCELLELYVEESPDMGLVISLVNPIITAMLGLDQDRKRQEDLLNKIRNLLLMLGRVRKFKNNGEATIEFIVDEFNTFFSTALTMRDEFNPIIRGCYFLFMRSGLQLLGEEAHDSDNMLIQSYLSHLREIFTRSKFKLGIQTVTDVCLSDCGGLWSVAELMKEFSFNTDLKCYWRTQAMQILITLYSNKPLLSRVDSKVIINFEKDLSSKICETLGPDAPLESISGHYLAEIFRVLFIMRKNESLKKLPCGINWEEIGSVLVLLRQRFPSKRFKVCRGPYSSIVNNLGLYKLVVKARQDQTQKAKAETPNNVLDEVPNDVEPVKLNQKLSKKIKKVKNIKKVKKIKKQAGEVNADSDEKVTKSGIKRKLKTEKVLENGDLKSHGKGKKKKKINIDSR